jgi:NitT/TauT family transport system substrate-binding protein
VKFAALLIALALMPLSAVAQTPPPDTIKLAVFPSIYNEIPLFLAIDEGFFAQQNLNVQVITHQGSSQVIIPELVRGTIDIAPLSASPSFFNQVAQGFDSKIIASANSSHKGWNPSVWVMVRQSVWDAKQIRVPRDLRGKHFDSATAGSEGWYLSRQLMTNAALSPADLTFSSRFTTPIDWLASLRNVNDAQIVYEPTVTQLETERVGHRWLSIQDVDPTYQESYLAASSSILKSHPDAVRRFLIAYIKAGQMIVAAHGKWTPELIRVTAKWTGLAPDVVAAIPTPPYTGDSGWINVPSLEKVQRFWHTMDLVKTEVPVSSVIDTNLIGQAQKAARVTVHAR